MTTLSEKSAVEEKEGKRRRGVGTPPYNRTRTSPTFLSKNGSEKRRRDDATFRRGLDGRNLREERYRCPMQ